MRRFVALAAAPLTLGVLLATCGSDDDPAAQGGAGTLVTMGEEGMMDEDGMMGGRGDGHMGDDHGESSDVAAGARRIEVTATSFEFDPDEIRVDAGEKIAIVLTSEDILHDFPSTDSTSTSPPTGARPRRAGSPRSSPAATPTTAPWPATGMPAWKAPSSSSDERAARQPAMRRADPRPADGRHP